MEKTLSRRGAETNLFASLLILALTAAAVALFREPIAGFFATNAALNAVIAAVFVIGACYALYWLLDLQREFRSLERVRGRFRAGDDQRWLEADALSTLPRSEVRDRLALYASQIERGCPPTGESHAEKVAVSLGLHTSVTRYTASLLVFLGLLGTFVGLLMTLGGIERVIGTLPAGGDTDPEQFFSNLKAGLAQPLHGMATAFGTSVFGLVTSLILGFIHLQLASAQTRFISRLEALDASLFLPAFLVQAGRAGAPAPAAARTVASPPAASSGAGTAMTETIARYLEATQRQLKDNLDRLMTIVERTEAMQANYREVMITLGREIETTNAAIARLATNQDLVREATGALVDLTRTESDNSRLMLSEVKSMNQSLARLSAEIKSAQTANRDYQTDLLRVLRREAETIERMRNAQ